jgi:S1-C subfamily serine protease
MISPRPVIATAVVVFLALLFFSLGSWTTQRTMAGQIAANETRIAALHDEMAQSILQRRQEQTARATGTAGVASEAASRAALIDEIKRELQSEMGLLPLRVIRQRRESFVELKAYDAAGESSYSTAGYLGDGYFITVKHGVVDLADREGRRPRITSVKINYKGKELPVRVVDSGNADSEVHPGDWAIVKVRGKVDLPPLRVDTGFSYQFADPIVRLGNDYSKGIMLSTGYIGERTSNGLVTCLTDGHPGVSGGGVLDQEGNLVGIPIGRMVGDYRFSFLLPLRAEMFRKVPNVLHVHRS